MGMRMDFFLHGWVWDSKSRHRLAPLPSLTLIPYGVRLHFHSPRIRGFFIAPIPKVPYVVSWDRLGSGRGVNLVPRPWASPDPLFIKLPFKAPK